MKQNRGHRLLQVTPHGRYANLPEPRGNLGCLFDERTSSTNFHMSSIHAPHSIPITPPMKQHIPLIRNRRTTGSIQLIIRRQYRNAILTVRPRDTRSSGNTHVILDIRKAMRRIKQQIRPVTRPNQRRRFYQGAIRCITINQLDSVANRRNPIFRNSLQHNWRCGNWFNAIVTLPAVADTVSVHFVEDIARAVRVLETAGVDGATTFEWACDWVGGDWSVRTRWVDAVGYCDADAVAVGAG
ncbi:hypothetical protein TMatcc_002373 [Talaromyces marneffei ATCC 18224]